MSVTRAPRARDAASCSGVLTGRSARRTAMSSRVVACERFRLAARARWEVIAATLSAGSPVPWPAAVKTRASAEGAGRPSTLRVNPMSSATGHRSEYGATPCAVNVAVAEHHRPLPGTVPRSASSLDYFPLGRKVCAIGRHTPCDMEGGRGRYCSASQSSRCWAIS